MTVTYYMVTNGEGILLETTDLKRMLDCQFSAPKNQHGFGAMSWSDDDLERLRRLARRRYGKNWLIGSSDIAEA